MRHRKVRLMLTAENSQTAAGSNISNWTDTGLIDANKSVHGVNISEPRTKHGPVLKKRGSCEKSCTVTPNDS